MKITNDEGRPFLIRVVKKGDKYGLDDCLIHDEAEPLIEFYDLSVNLKSWGERGQFAARYYASTLAEDAEDLARRGLCLHGGIAEWGVDGKALAPVLKLAQELAGGAT